MMIGPKEYIVVIYHRVVYKEQVEVIDETTLEHMIHTFGQVVRRNYGMLLSRDLVKGLTDNLRVRYPALIDGVIPEKISYGLLQEVLKRFLDRGNYPLYLPRVIESLESALYKEPNASVEALEEQVCADLETPDNITFFYAGRMWLVEPDNHPLHILMRKICRGYFYAFSCDRRGTRGQQSRRSLPGQAGEGRHA